VKIRNFFLIVSLLGLLAQPPSAAPRPPQAASQATSITQEIWRTYTNSTFYYSLAFYGGYLWTGTEGGVVRWNTSDGSYIKYTTVDGLAGDGVISIASDPTGNLWFGTWNNGVSMFDGSKWTTYTTADGPAGYWINAIASDSAGNMWFGTDCCGTSKFDGSHWTTYTIVDGLAGNYVNAIASDSAGNVWFGTWGYGVSEFNGTAWTTYTTADGLASNYIGAIASDPEGNLWVGTGDGVSKFDGTAWTTYTTADGLAGNWITAIASDPAGNLWFGTWDSGVSKYDGFKWTTYTSADGLAGNWIDAITSDPAGNLWFGTKSCYIANYSAICAGVGLSKFDGAHWTTYATANSLADNSITTIASDPAGNIWFGTSGHGVSKFDGANWTTYTTADGLADNSIIAIASDPAGNVWFGAPLRCERSSCHYSGVSKFDGTNWVTHFSDNGLACSWVNAIASDPAGDMWFGIKSEFADGCYSVGGVSKFDGLNWTYYTTADGLADDSVTAIASDSAGNMWFGTEGYGVSKFDGTHWTTYITADGLAGNWITAIASDPGGNMWFGTRYECNNVGQCDNGHGISKFDGVTWTTYTTADGLADNVVSAVASDPSGNVWVGARGRVSKFDGVAWTTFGPIGNWIQAIASDVDGNLWFAPGSGVSELYFARSLNATYASGALGSYFNLTSDHFPANQNVPVTVNGAQLGNIPISSHGTFTFTISTSNVSQGLYIIKVGERPSVQLRLWLDSRQPIRPKEGDYPLIDIPADIALTPRSYLPTLCQ
jgi:ligand-binding sensor domain-containing protein